MKITMYELLGLVKDGKNPKKIKYDNIIFEYDGIYYMTEHTYLDEYCDLSRVLNEPVEILEEKKIPEKLPLIENTVVNYPNDEFIERILNLFYELNNKNRLKINEIIDYLKSKGDE